MISAVAVCVFEQEVGEPYGSSVGSGDDRMVGICPSKRRLLPCFPVVLVAGETCGVDGGHVWLGRGGGTGSGSGSDGWGDDWRWGWGWWARDWGLGQPRHCDWGRVEVLGGVDRDGIGEEGGMVAGEDGGGRGSLDCGGSEAVVFCPQVSQLASEQRVLSLRVYQLLYVVDDFGMGDGWEKGSDLVEGPWRFFDPECCCLEVNGRLHLCFREREAEGEPGQGPAGDL